MAQEESRALYKGAAAKHFHYELRGKRRQQYPPYRMGGKSETAGGGFGAVRPELIR